MMSSDESQRPPSAQPHDDHQIIHSSRWLRRVIIAIAVVGVLALSVVFIPGVRSSRDTVSRMTHTVQRGDLTVTVIETGMLESSEDTEITCKVRGQSTVIWVIENGTMVEAGDVLVRLDTLVLENTVAERTKYAHWSRSAAERSQADVARGELAVSEYLEGRYPAELMTLEKDLAIAESDLLTAKAMLDHAELLKERGFKSAMEVEDRQYQVMQAELNLEVKKSQIDTLKQFTKQIQMETIKGNLKANRARHAADAERAKMDAKRRDLAKEELEYCIVRAEQSGMVIHPAAARWRNAPEIHEGATVHKDQVLLLMPDLSKMQVMLGIRESVIDRIKVGQIVTVTLPNQDLIGKVSTVAAVTRPASWWTGNVARYDTTVDLPPVKGLKPGMSAEVEVIVAQHEDVLTIPVAALLEIGKGDFCWVQTPNGPQRRTLKLGDTNDVFTVVEAGLAEGDQVLLNPLALNEARQMKLRDEEEIRKEKLAETESKQKESKSGKDASGSNKPKDPQPKKPSA